MDMSILSGLDVDPRGLVGPAPAFEPRRLLDEVLLPWRPRFADNSRLAILMAETKNDDHNLQTWMAILADLVENRWDTCDNITTNFPIISTQKT